MTVEVLAEPHVEAIRTGSHSPNEIGPLGDSARWQPNVVGSRRGSSLRDHEGAVAQTADYFQEREAHIIPRANIHLGEVVFECRGATLVELVLMDQTLQCVPSQHLAFATGRRARGFEIVSQIGRGANLRYTGGVNTHDHMRIQITHGALWQYRDWRICPTVFHELGHVLTGNGSLSYRGFSDERRAALMATDVSRHSGAPLEALCNVYMYFICYAAQDARVRDFGRGNTIQNDREARAGLRMCRAFTSLPEDTQRTFAERP